MTLFYRCSFNNRITKFFYKSNPFEYRLYSNSTRKFISLQAASSSSIRNNYFLATAKSPLFLKSSSNHQNKSYSIQMGTESMDTTSTTITTLDNSSSDSSSSPLEQKSLNEGIKVSWNSRSIGDERITVWRDKFFSDPQNLLALQACTRMDPLEVCLTRGGIEEISHVFTHKIEEVKPITNQKSSGRCWIFAFLNCLRVPFVKQYNLDEFEFSQSHLFFYDKIERCNYFLNNMVIAAKRKEPVEGRLVSFLLHDLVGDGGQWDMATNLVRKYGLMPKKCFPESYSSEASARLNSILRSKLREYTKEIREQVEKSKGDSEDDEKIQILLQRQMTEVFKIVSTCLGVPKDKFTWEYYDKSKAYHKIGPITPQKFYEDYVKQVYDIDNKVCLVHDPRPSHSYGKAYTVEFLGNVVNGRPTIYNNQPIELLLKLTGDSIKTGEPVWFGCEVSKRLAPKHGVQDLRIHDYFSVFGVDVSLGLSKPDRLIYGDSAMSHAMTFTAVSFDEETNAITKLRVENSWGDDRGEKGYFLMTPEWFHEFVFEIVVDKSLVSEEVLSVFSQSPQVLPAWDPLGALASIN